MSLVFPPFRLDVSSEQLWREDRIEALLDRCDDGVLFVSVCVSNQGTFYPRFDAVVLYAQGFEGRRDFLIFLWWRKRPVLLMSVHWLLGSSSID